MLKHQNKEAEAPSHDVDAAETRNLMLKHRRSMLKHYDKNIAVGQFHN